MSYTTRVKNITIFENLFKIGQNLKNIAPGQRVSRISIKLIHVYRTLKSLKVSKITIKYLTLINLDLKDVY